MVHDKEIVAKTMKRVKSKFNTDEQIGALLDHGAAAGER